jgi:hypothetical protein
MLQLIYKSVATVTISNSEFARLMMKTRVNNELVDITGLLVRHGENFLQLLEGPEAAVESTFRRIAADPRHKTVQVLLRQKITQRSFTDWSMGYVCSYGTWFEYAPGAVELFELKGNITRFSGETAFHLLREFRFNPWRRKVDLGYAPLTMY